MSTPANSLTIFVAYAAPPNEYAALIFCLPFVPISTRVSRGIDISVTFLSRGSTRARMMVSVRYAL